MCVCWCDVVVPFWRALCHPNDSKHSCYSQRRNCLVILNKFIDGMPLPGEPRQKWNVPSSSRPRRSLVKFCSLFSKAKGMFLINAKPIFCSERQQKFSFRNRINFHICSFAIHCWWKKAGRRGQREAQSAPVLILVSDVPGRKF